MIEIYAIPGERRFMLLRATRPADPAAARGVVNEATIAVQLADGQMVWELGEYQLKLMFRGSQLVVIERGAEPIVGVGMPLDGLYQRAGVVVAR